MRWFLASVTQGEVVGGARKRKQLVTLSILHPKMDMFEGQASPRVLWMISYQALERPTALVQLLHGKAVRCPPKKTCSGQVVHLKIGAVEAGGKIGAAAEDDKVDGAHGEVGVEDIECTHTLSTYTSASIFLIQLRLL